MSESNNNTPMRITQLEEATAYENGMYYAVAKAGGGTKKISTSVPNGAMGYKLVDIKGLTSISAYGLRASSGEVFSSANHNCSEFLPIKTGQIIHYSLRGTSDTVGLIVIYNSSKVFSSCVAVGAGATVDVKGSYYFIADGYIRICNRADNNNGFFYFD